MKNKILQRYGCLVCLLLASVIKTTAQTDPHFTQNYTYPMYINPALTGSSDGEYRVSSIYRSQWGSISNPYRTMGVSFDTRTDKNISLGANLMNQTAGDGGFDYLNAYATVAYTGFKFGRNVTHHIVFAMQGGIINRRVNESKFKWGEQWNPITGYNSSNPTTETFARSSSATLDIGAGALYYDASPEKKYNVFGGLSVFHINKPYDRIVSMQGKETNTIPVRYSFHGGVSYNFSERLYIIPHVLYMHQGTANEVMLGTYVQLNVNAETDVLMGAYYRYKDALAPFFGLDYKNFIVGLSYDANISRLGGATTRNVNSFELSLTYIKRKESKSIFDFIRCSRL